MEGGRRSLINGGSNSFGRRDSGRQIPLRGRVKVAIVVGLANSVASIFSRTRHSSRLSRC
ncbi:hypothetical protein QN277_020153 [Acacia crassicarpa]|uniref:Uncharacterized protein n=1 Tax=Acacia crassicarpa TaxID=499986 RepID=A0AAE1JMD2_9FABA|nr:hypothetical protein QN277_020153 [Acacia crassicarpa]